MKNVELEVLSHDEMANTVGGNCIGGAAAFAFGAGGLILLTATTGVGEFFFGAAGGWFSMIGGAIEMSHEC